MSSRKYIPKKYRENAPAKHIPMPGNPKYGADGKVFIDPEKLGRLESRAVRGGNSDMGALLLLLFGEGRRTC